jgi:four helix bundle protein
MKPYERLLAGQRCHELTPAICSLTKSWPDTERYGIIAQIRRAAVSAPNNIVEGYAKRGAGELRRYLDISLGSLAEVGYLLRLARDLGTLPPEAWQAAEAQREDSARLTWKLDRSLGV